MTTPTPKTSPGPASIIGGKYRIEEAIGDGGMGKVYRATQLDIGRSVALKLLRPEHTSNPRVVKRFMRESKATARVEHPNTVRLYDYGESDGQIFLAMELVQGRTLSRELGAHGPLPIERAVRIAVQIARGLAAVHAEGVVHRDLKPSNLMLCHQDDLADHVKVLDFGIAHFADPVDDSDRERLTQSGMVMGTPEFMAPEQVTPGPVDARADLYALGCVLFLLVTGTVPFRGQTAVATMYSHVTDAPPRPSSFRADLPPWLDDLILRLLEKAPDQRFPDALSVVEALELGAGLDHRDTIRPVTPKRPPALPRGPLRLSIGILAAVVAGTLMVGLTLGLGLAWVLGGG